MDYKSMIKDAQSKGLANEKKMWESITQLGGVLENLKHEHPDMYWAIMRKQHGIMYDKHYTPEFAEHDVSLLCYTDSEGKKHQGAHWTREQVNNATASLTFPTDVTECDKYVAYNATYADFCSEFSSSDILKMAYLFWFKDEDWGSTTKIWEYMCLHQKINL